MLYKIYFIAIILTLVFTRPLPVVASDRSVVINELMWMGTSTSSADEWIELRNTTSASIDLAGWQLTKKSGGVEVPMLTIPAGSTIAPDGLFLISNYAETSATSMLSRTPDLVTTDVALSNSALQIRLYDQTHVMIDTADDGSGNPLAGVFDTTKKIYAAMERNPQPGDGALPQSWHTASHSTGLKVGPEIATPGNQNSNALPIAVLIPSLTGLTGQPVNFDGSDSTDPEGQALSFAWDFGDAMTASDVAPTHVYTQAGIYAVQLTVNDGTDSSIALSKVTISDPPPLPTVSSVATATAVPSIAPTISCSGILLSELLPNPTGADSDEFIELWNSTGETAQIGGCQIWIGTRSVWSVPAGTQLPPGEFFLVRKTDSHLTLPNAAGGTVRLLDPNSTVDDNVDYPAALENQSWARFGSSWSWTTILTPGGTNQETPDVSIADAMIPAAATKKSAATKKPKTTVKKAKAVVKKATVTPPVVHSSLADIQNHDSGDRVIIRGTVAAPLDVLGLNTTTIFDDHAGVNIQFATPRKLTVGAVIEISGTVRTKDGRRRVVMTTKDTFRVVSQSSPEQPGLITTGDVDGDFADRLVTVHGTIGAVSGNHFTVDDGSGEVPIYIKSSTGIVRPKMKMGDTATVVGVVSAGTSGVRILPRLADDLHIERVLGATTVGTPAASTPTSSAHQTMWYWLLVGVGVLVASGRPLWHWWQQQKNRPEL